jgi:hypothetical protein
MKKISRPDEIKEAGGRYLINKKWMPMHAHFTEEHLILYIYNELSESESLALTQAMESDAGLREQYKALLETTTYLSYGLAEPDPTTIEVIMEHAHYEELPH